MTHNEYWERMRDRAADELHGITGRRVESEEDLKCALAHVMREGTCGEAADALVEGMEYMAACLELRRHEEVATASVIYGEPEALAWGRPSPCKQQP